MAVTPQTELRLLKCNLNLDNNNQLTFSNATAQYNYFNGLTKKTITDISYQRKDSYIRFPEHIDNIIEYNYVMYKNNNYTNKWFYAYVTRMEYENDNCTRIYIKTDVFQTWQFDLTFMSSFVEREHVNDDGVGKHTIPENLETGEYIINATDYMMYDVNYYPVIAVSSVRNTNFLAPGTTDYNNIFSGEYLFTFSSKTEARNFLKIFDEDGQADSINSVYMIPGTIYNDLEKSSQSNTEHGITCNYYTINGTSGEIIESQKTVSMQTTLNGYTPKNNKLKCFPYNYLEVTNNNGGSAVYHYEKFVSNSPSFQVAAALTPGCSVMCYPLNYNLKADDHIITTGILYSYNDGIPGGKYPIGSWRSDVYTNWLTQNGVNNVWTQLKGSFNAIMGAAGSKSKMGAVEGSAGGIASIIDVMVAEYQHSLSPYQEHGDTSSGDVTYSMKQTMFLVKKKSIKYEYAKMIDDFFSMYGYKVNSVKVPNITGRSNWNYVKLINPNIEAYIPQEDLAEIKNLFSNGITLWHTTTHFLDYSQNNSII